MVRHLIKSMVHAWLQAWEEHCNKQFSGAIDGILRALVKKDNQIQRVFFAPVDANELPDYPDIIKQPMCISQIMCVPYPFPLPLQPS